MATRDDVGEALRAARTIAIVGCSPRPDRDSHRVARYLKEAGYRIVPVNPGAEHILDEPVYPDLEAIPADIELDIVDVFRSPEHVPPIVEAAIGRGAKRRASPYPRPVRPGRPGSSPIGPPDLPPESE